ncbi:MAG TPA: helix-turn-helix domain-containing protein [Terriglobales bacterium]|nr:helix-turn-helix domain-containing protein [Terriglobales bacterium]
MKEQLESLVLQMVRSGIRYGEAIREFKKAFLTKVLVEHRGNQCQAARVLGMHRNSLGRTLAHLKMDARALRTQLRRPPRSERPAPVRRTASGR